MGIDSNDIIYALQILKYITIERKEWNPESSHLFEGSDTLDTSFQEIIKHAFSLRSFDVKYNVWFQNKKLNYDNFKQLVDLESKNSIKLDSKDEEFLSFSIKIGVWGYLGYKDGITKAPNYAISCIMNTLRVFRAEKKSQPYAILSFIRWQNNVINVEKNVNCFSFTMSDLKKVLDSLKTDESQKTPISFTEYNIPEYNKLKIEKELDIVLGSKIDAELPNIDKESRNKPNYFWLTRSEDQTKNQLKIKQNENGLCGENYSNCSKNKDDAIVLNGQSTSGEIPKQIVLQPPRQLSNLSQFSDQSKLKPESLLKCILPIVRNETVKSINFNKHDFQIENKNQNLDEIQNKLDLSDSSEPGSVSESFDSNDEKTNIDSLTPIKQTSPKNHMSKGKTKLIELYSDEKLKTSPNPKPLKRIKTCKEIESFKLDNAQ